MKNIRKLAALLLAVVLCASLAACAAPQTSVETLETSSTTEDGEPITTEKDPADFEMDVDGMCDYFEASGLVVGERVQMSYDVIGAVNGYKYTYQYNDSSVQLELYEFPTENIPEAAQTVIDSVRDSGQHRAGAAFGERPVHDHLYRRQGGKRRRGERGASRPCDGLLHGVCRGRRQVRNKETGGLRLSRP